ncbi:MAG: rhomboid family intramembrane serine protease [Tepidisphaerales bacterium]
MNDPHSSQPGGPPEFPDWPKSPHDGRAPELAAVRAAEAEAARRLEAAQAEAARQQEAAKSLAAMIAGAAPVVTMAVLILNILAYVASGVITKAWFAPTAQQLLSIGADHWATTTSGQWWRLLSSAFLHFGLIHLFANMQAMLCVGRLAEGLYGSRTLGFIYFFGAIVSGIASIWWTPQAVCVGASGAVFAVYGALAAYLVFQRGSFPAGVAQSLLANTAVFVGYNVIFGLTTPGISNAAHLGGLGAGFALGAIMARPTDPQRRARQAFPRAVAGVAASVAVAGTLLWAMPKVEPGYRELTEFRGDWHAFLEAQDGIVAGYGRLFNQVAQPQVESAAFVKDADAVAGQWEKWARQLSRARMPDTLRARAVQRAVVAFCEKRRDVCRLLSAAVRDDDAARIERVAPLAKESEELLKEIERLRAGAEVD